MIKRRLLLVGGGGHCRSVLDSVSMSGAYEDIAVIDQAEHVGKKIGCATVIGTDKELPGLRQRGYTDAFVSIGSIGNTLTRVRHVSSFCKVEEGAYIGKASNINCDCYIGAGSIINTAATIEHECRIGQFVHIAPGAVVCGGTFIGDNSHIGAHATIIQGIHIGEGVMVGAGCVVIRDIQAGKTVVGVPGRHI